MNQKRAIQTSQTRLEVPLNDGTVWRGTEAQLRREHPDWLQYAKRVQPRAQARSTTRADWQNSTSTILRDENGRITVLDDPDSDIEDEVWPQRLPTSTRRYNLPPTVGNARYEVHPNQTIPRRAHAAPTTSGTRGTEDISQAEPKRQRRGFFAHPLLYLGVGMIAMLTLWVFGQMAVSAWQLHQDDSTYGRPRTYQFDAVFGHADSASNPTHIIIINLNRHVILIELPGGDATRARIYNGPTLFQDGGDLVPVTGKAIDVNNDGKPDLVLFIQDQRIVFINDGTQFRPAKPGDHITLPQ
jgi:hypothetical protein